MSRFNVSRRSQLALGAAVLLGLGAAGGAGAVSLTRPGIEMAPTVPTAIAKLGNASGIVTVKGRVAEVFGDRIVLQDGSGRTMIDTGPQMRGTIAAGTPLAVQGRYADGQLHASYLIDSAGKVSPVGPGEGPGGRPGPHGHPGPGGPEGPGGPRGPGGPGGPGGPEGPGGPGAPAGGPGPGPGMPPPACAPGGAMPAPAAMPAPSGAPAPAPAATPVARR